MTRLSLTLLNAAIALLLLPCAATAGGKGTMIGHGAGGGKMTVTITWRDASTVRVDLSNRAGAFITHDGKTYAVKKSDGEAQVKETRARPLETINSVKATGATDTVAGITGRVYHMTWTNPDGSQGSGDALLTDDPLVAELFRANLVAGSGSAAADAYLNALPGNDRGVLRMDSEDEQYEVGSVSRADPPASLFALHAQSTDLQSRSDADKQCTDKACFSAQFAECQRATYTTEKQPFGAARYQIQESGAQGCRVQMTYVDNPNPAWQGKSLTMALDSGRPFEPQMKSAVADCLIHDAPGAYQCSGELRGIAARSRGFPGMGR